MSTAVVFDLDGTLTVPYLDFDAIRSELGLPAGPILESLAELPEDAQRRAWGVLDRHEREAAENATLQQGAVATVEQLRRRGWTVGVLTRNTHRWATFVLDQHGLTVDGVRGRDDGEIKPSPRPLRELCRSLGADPRESWMVGDHLFDLLSGRGAGTRTVLMLGDRPSPDYVDQADAVIRRLPELLEIVGPAADS